MHKFQNFKLLTYKVFCAIFSKMMILDDAHVEIFGVFIGFSGHILHGVFYEDFDRFDKLYKWWSSSKFVQKIEFISGRALCHLGISRFG